MRKLLLASAATLGATLALGGGAKAQPVTPVAPGSVVVHVNGYLQFEIGNFGSSSMSGGSGGTAYKLNSVGTAGDVRVYLGFDGATADGIAYGSQVELRTTTSDAGKGASNNGSTGNQGDIYVRRAYGYLGTTDAGFVRFGQTDGAFTLLQSGVIEAFGDGSQWSSDGGPVMLLANNAPGEFIYADQGALYTTDKLVYISPSFGGLSGAVSYEPSSNGIKQGYASASSDLGYSDGSIGGGSSSRRRNTVDVMAQYKLAAGGFASKFSAGYLTGAPLGNLTGAQAYDSLSVFQAGAQTTFGGLTVGANIKTGAVQDGYSFKPKGGRDALAYTVGASYVLGPYVLGASFFDSQTAGKAPAAHVAPTLEEYGAAVGGNYVIAKPLSLFVEYMYGHEHQPGNSSLGNGNGNGQAQVVAAGATLKW